MQLLAAIVLTLAASCFAEEEKKYVAVPYGALPYAHPYGAAYPYAGAGYPYAAAGYPYAAAGYQYAASPYAVRYAGAPAAYPYGFASYQYAAPAYTVKSTYPYPSLKLDTTKEPAAYAGAYPYAAFPTAEGYGVIKKAE